MDSEHAQHVPVLVAELMAAIQPHDSGSYADCTFGRGGHTRALLALGGAAMRVLAVDRDPQAVSEGRKLAAADPRLEVVQAPFSDLLRVASERDARFDAVYFDLGVSSPQIDTAERGFSFRHDGPLDMRMDPQHGVSAADWLARARADEIAVVLRDFGEERYARRIAAYLVEARTVTPITRTLQLAELVFQAMPGRARHAEPGQHPATRTFQAIRIHINRELHELDAGLGQALESLKAGGRLAVISFHSLEDRLVKRFMRDLANPPMPSRHMPVAAEQPPPRLRLLGKPVRASREELQNNPRSRSAVLRAAVKLN
ncbi:MAG: 16S rRNA (cytosine1402-N4)-methyltransferase [Gammaproteobacteria bacterium]